MAVISPHTFFNNLTSFVSQSRGVLQFNMNGTRNLKAEIAREAGSNADIVEQGIRLLETGLRTKSFTIPGQSFATYDPMSFSGPSRKVAYQPIFTDLNVEFYLAGSTLQEARSLYHTLRAWQHFIAGPIRAANERQYGPTPDVTLFGVAYYKDYVCDIDAYLHTPENKEAIHVKFYDAYPMNLGDIQMSWENSDAPIALSATFAYFYNEPQ